MPFIVMKTEYRQSLLKSLFIS